MDDPEGMSYRAPSPSAALRSRWLSPFALILLWEIASRTGLLPEHVLAAPSAVLMTLVDLVRSGELPSNLLISFGRVALGLGIGVTLGVAMRSEERRVGKECRSRWSPYH